MKENFWQYHDEYSTTLYKGKSHQNVQIFPHLIHQQRSVAEFSTSVTATESTAPVGRAIKRIRVCNLSICKFLSVAGQSFHRFVTAASLFIICSAPPLGSVRPTLIPLFVTCVCSGHQERKVHNYHNSFSVCIIN